MEVETLEHFLLECGSLGEVRRMSGMEGVPICELLLFGVRGEEVRDEHRGYIGRLWRKREADLLVEMCGAGCVGWWRWRRWSISFWSAMAWERCDR